MQRSPNVSSVDRFALLDTFVRIADAGSISAAARTLRLSVPMASRHLRSLEQEYGVALVRRTTRRLDLTAAGKELLPRARHLLRDLEDARAAVLAPSGAAGRIVMSMPVAFGLRQIEPLIPALLAAHPGLSLDLRFEDRTVDLLGDGVHLALRTGMAPPDTSYVIARTLAAYPRVLCATPELLRRHPIPDVASLSRAPCVVLGVPPATWKFADGRTVAVDGRVHTNNMLAVYHAALGGLGVAQLPSWLVADDLTAGRLRTVLHDASLPPVTVNGIVSTETRHVEALRIIQDFLAARLTTAMKPPTGGKPRRSIREHRDRARSKTNP